MNIFKRIIKKLIVGPLDKHITSVIKGEISPRKVALKTALQFVKYNHIKGDYLEFGCCGANTFRYAYDIAKEFGLPIHFYGFDSFEGLPQAKGVDIHPDFSKGKFCQSQEDFRQSLYDHGIQSSEFTVVQGFYDKALIPELKKQLPIKKAAIIYIDCDLYESTKDVLNFVKDYLQTGTVICFDDYFCFNGDPQRGESLAKKEFLKANPNIFLRNYFNFGWQGKAFICKRF